MDLAHLVREQLASDMSPSRNEWPALESHYEDQYGSIDLEVYKTAGELWPAAKAFAEFALKDQDASVDLMLQAAAKVSCERKREATGHIDLSHMV